MNKYIDADLLRKEIDKWTGAMSDKIEDDYSDGIRFALNHFVFVLDSLQQEQPILPSNLDEAAFEYENTLWEDGCKDCGYSPLEVFDAFKAGAEWMVKQGVTVNGYITDEIAYNGVAVILDSEGNFKSEEEVTVQIRKK